jgi:hypothetical protein
MVTFSLPAHPLGDGVVTLRPWTEADLPALEAATRDPEIVRRNRLPQPFDAAAWFEQSSVEQEQGLSLRLLIVDPATGRSGWSATGRRPSFRSDASSDVWTRTTSPRGG